MGLNDIAERIISMDLLPTSDYKYYCCVKVWDGLCSKTFESVKKTPEAAIQMVAKAVKEVADLPATLMPLTW